MIMNLVMMTHFLVMTPFTNDMKGSPPPRASDIISDIMISIILCFSILRPFLALNLNVKGPPPPRASNLLLEVLRTQSQVPLLRAQGKTRENCNKN